MKVVEQAETERQKVIDEARRLLSSVTTAEPLGAEWDPFWNSVIFIMDDENVLMVTLNDAPSVGLLVRCKGCRALFWVRVNATNLFYVSRGYVPPNTHICSQHVPALPPHIRDAIKTLSIPELKA